MVKRKPHFSSEFLDNFALALATHLPSPHFSAKDIEMVFKATKHMEQLLIDDHNKQLEEYNKNNYVLMEVKP